MTNLDNFEGLVHIKKIRERLWLGREFGQAAVMVGTGFSRNAESSRSDKKPFPLWSELAGAMFEELYPVSGIISSEEEEKREKLKQHKIANAPTLAEEFAVTFERTVLDDLLLRLIPDEQYLPANLHTLLLNLPWSDVFTTNYDTLCNPMQTCHRIRFKPAG